MIIIHQAAIAMPNTMAAMQAAHHNGHQEYGGKKPSSPAPSAISPSGRSSGRGSIRQAWKPRENAMSAASSVVMTSAAVPVGSPAISQYDGATSMKNSAEAPKIH